MAKSRNPKDRLPELMRRLEVELRHLRLLVKDIFRNCEFRLHAQIEQAASDLLRTVPSIPGAAGMRKRQSVLLEALSALEGLRVKPEKGRHRDIKRLHALADELTHLAARMQ